MHQLTTKFYSPGWKIDVDEFVSAFFVFGHICTSLIFQSEDGDYSQSSLRAHQIQQGRYKRTILPQSFTVPAGRQTLMNLFQLFFVFGHMRTSLIFQSEDKRLVLEFLRLLPNMVRKLQMHQLTTKFYSPGLKIDVDEFVSALLCHSWSHTYQSNI